VSIPHRGLVRPDRGTAGVVVLTAVLYLAAGRFGHALAEPTELGPGFWPGAGITLAALLLTRRGTWPFILATVGMVELASGLLGGHPLLASSVWTIAHVAEPVVVATLLQLRGGVSLSDVRSMVRFLLAVTVGAFVIGGPLAALGTWLVGTNEPLLVVAGHWAFADALGMLALTPAVLVLRSPSGRASLRGVGVGASLLAVAATCLLVFGWSGRTWEVAPPYLILPSLVWVAFRFRLDGAAVGVFVVASIATVATGIGHGPFAGGGADANEAVVLLQFFLVTASVTALLLGSQSTESRRNQQDATWQQHRAEREAALRSFGHTAQLAGNVEGLRAAVATTIGPLVAPMTVDLVVSEAGTLEIVADGPEPDDPVRRDHLLDDVRMIAEQAAARLAAEAALSDANQALRAALSARDRFLSIVSHELRTPLTPIVGFSELLLERSELIEEDRVGLEAVARQGRHLTALVDRLLLLAELTERGATPERVRVAVATLARQVVDGLGLGGVDITLDGSGMAWFDPDHLRQVLGDLLVNAHRFGEPPITVGISGNGDVVHLVVEDKGPGIPADFREQVFEPFVQPNTSELNPSTGLGIGLALARVLVEANGGTIDHHPAAGGGARFVLTLPAASGGDVKPREGSRSAHDVLFYGEPASAWPRIADWLLPGLVAGLPTVVIATAEHRKQIAAALSAAAGGAFERARMQDRYVELDAQSLLQHLVIDGVPDTALLDEVWAQLLARVGGEPLQVFGEMTALAVAEGLLPAALQLEELWDGISREAACDVYCAFPHAALHDHHGLSLADRISQIHRSATVVGGR